jgi:O-antigen ligase
VAVRNGLGLVWVTVLLGLLHVGRDNVLLCGLALATAAGLTTVVVLGTERTATLLIFLGMVFSPLTELTVIPGSTLVTYADLFFALGFVLLFPTLLRGRFDVPPVYVVGMVIVLATSLVASATADHPAVSLNLMARLVLAVMFFPLIFMVWRPDVLLCVRLAQGYMLGAATTTLYGYLVAGPSPGDADLGRYDGLSEHPNALALITLLALLLTPFVTAYTSSPWSWLWWGVGAVCLFGMWLSGSRATLAAFIALALLYPVIERSLKAAWLLIAAATAGLVFAGKHINPDSDNPIGRLLGGGSAAGSNAQRETALDTGIAQFHQHPVLGNGFEHALDAHMIYLEVAVCIGVVGLFGYLLMLWPGIQPILTAPRPLHRISYPVLGYAMVGVLTPVLWDRYIWSVVALSFVVAAQRHPAPVSSAPSPALVPAGARS